MLSAAAVGGARHYSQLVCWQLADAARIVIFKFTRRRPFSADFKHRSQSEDAIDSVCRNIAEGFGCISHGEFARYLEIARRSLNEVCDCVRSAHLKRYVSETEIREFQAFSRRLYPALNNFIAYLKRNPTGRHRCAPHAPRDNPAVAFRKHLIELLSDEPRSVSSLARQLGMTRGDVEEDLRHALRSARAAGHDIEVIPARCKACDFVFGTDKLTKPGRCPSCKGSRVFEPMIRIAPSP
jgi:four helix bundle protein